MRIAVTGTHRTGKTSLVAELGRRLPSFTTIAEPYVQLEEEGHRTPETPGVDDFEHQLERSIASILESEENSLFDRSPFDILAYLVTHEDAGRFDVDKWYPGVEEAIQRLDLVVFVPIEIPDRLALAASEDAGLRRRVDAELHEFVLDDRWGLGFTTVEVTGPLRERVQRVLEIVRQAS
jgi:predicted ATPase